MRKKRFAKLVQEVRSICIGEIFRRKNLWEEKSSEKKNGVSKIKGFVDT